MVPHADHAAVTQFTQIPVELIIGIREASPSRSQSSAARMR